MWDVLLRCDGGRTPWGSDNSELVSLYADADSGECPFAGIHAGGQTQSCGNSRFGCWVCTVVKEDKSLNGFIKSGHRELIPLAEFRSWLMSIRDNEEYREKKRRNGTVYRDKQGNMGFGPFNWKARKLILRKLLETQQVMGYELITLDELKAIDEIWDQELDLSRRVLVELYEKITGERLPWYDYKEPLIDNETVVELENLAQKNNVPEELIRNLLLSVYRNKNYSNQKILRDGIDRLFNYVFIDRKTNGNIKNLYLLEKVEVLANPDKNIKGYSEKVIQLVSDKLNLPDLKEFDSEEEAKGELDRYFQMNFRNQYAQFAASVIEMISKGE